MKPHRLAIAQNLGRHGASVMVSSRKVDKVAYDDANDFIFLAQFKMRNVLFQAANVEKAVEQLKSEGLDVDGMVRTKYLSFSSV